ncbi:MAG: hypothetical protein AAF471_09805, partial [Myxococcota bacterium]
MSGLFLPTSALQSPRPHLLTSSPLRRTKLRTHAHSPSYRPYRPFHLTQYEGNTLPLPAQPLSHHPKTSAEIERALRKREETVERTP